MRRLFAFILALGAGCGSPAPNPSNGGPPSASSGDTAAESPALGTAEARPTSGELPCSEGGTIDDLSVGPSEVCVVTGGRLLCLGSGHREPLGLRAIEGPPNLRRVSVNGRRIFAIDAEGTLWRWKDGEIAPRPPEALGPAADVVVGNADGSRDPVCVVSEEREARCYLARDEGELGEPKWTIAGALEVQVLNRYFCVRTAGTIECRPTHDFGDEDVTLEAEGATGFYWDYRRGCALFPDGPRCTGDLDTSEAFGGTHPVQARVGWLDSRWGSCAITGDATHCQLGGGPQHAVRLEGAPTELGMGKEFACALCGSTVSCWGEMRTLGDLGGPLFSGPKRVEGIEGATAIYGGTERSYGMCAEFESGALHCWGDGVGGVRVVDGPEEGVRREDLESDGPCELRDGAVTCESGPLRVEGALQLTEGGTRGRCVRTEDAVFCSYDDDEPTRMAVDARDVSISNTGEFCIVTSEGTLQCGKVGPMYGTLGGNIWGTGDGLHPIEGITDAVDVAVTQEAACVLHEDGHVSCFGTRLDNRLGDGGTFASQPVVVDFGSLE